MKSQFKRFSKSTLSVVLAFCMLVSCMMVGLIATDAARAAEEQVGASSTYTVYFRNNGNWSNVYILTGSNLNMSGSSGAYEDLYGSNINGFTAMSLVPGETKVYKATVTVYDNKVAFASVNSTQSGYYASNGQICCVGDMSSGKVVNMWTDSWTSRNGAAYKKYNLEDYSPPTPNITGINGDWSTGDGMSFDSGNNYYYAFTGDGNDKFFRFKFNNTYYEAYADGFNLETGSGGPYDGSSDSKKYGARSGNNNAFKLTASTDYNYRIYFDISGKKTWFTKTERTHSVAIKQQLGSNAATNVSTATIGNITGVNVTANETVTSGGSSYTFDHWAISGGTVSISDTQNGTYTSKAAGTTYSTRNIYVKTSSDSAVLTAVYVLNLPALDAPTNVKLNGSAANCTVEATTVGAKINLTWNSVANAGSYKIYKGDTLVDTVTGGSTTTYGIERANSSTGKYTVVAVPSNTSAYSESAKSTGYTLTVNKKTLTAPTVTVTPTGIALGSSVNLTATDTNSGVTAAQYNLYYYETSLSATNDYLLTSGTAKSITPTTAGTHTYKVIAYPINGSSNDYYTQSSAVSASTVTVYAPSWYIIGDLVDSTNNKWNTSLQDYPVDEYVSPNVFKRTVTYASGGTNDKHYFRLNNGTNQYTVTNGTDTNMATHTTSGTAVTASTATTSGSMYVTGQGTYKIYVNQATSGSPKVWVEKTEPQKYTTVVYVNKDSGATNMYVWKDANNKVSEWPGESITSVEETINDITYYKYTFESYWDHFDIVVNKGDGNNQSADLTNIAANKTYYVIWDGGATTTASISETAPVIQLGYKVQNSSSNNHADFSSLTRSVTVSLAANTTYEFWLKSANSHLNDENAGTMTRANCSNWHFPVGNTNTKIQADLAGNYTFTYTVSSGNIYVSVTYPPEPKYNVTVNQGDHGTVTVNGSSFTSGNTIQIGSLTTASIEAVPASGYHFTGWTTSGGVAAVSGYTTSSNPITISASATGSITATYAEDSYTLTLASAGNGSITTPSSKTLTVHPITATSLSGVTVTPANGYKFNGWTTGTGVTLENGSSSSASTGSIKATQNSTLTANFTKISYSLTGKTTLNGTVGNYGTVKFYNNSACTSAYEITTAQIGNTVYAKFTSSSYSLLSFSKSGTGSSGGTTSGNVYSFTMGYANTTVTAAVRQLTSVTYYVDMHDNSVSTMSIAVVQNMGGTPVKDGKGNDCSATLGDTSGDYRLTKQGDSTVYAASINTPNPTGDLYVKITFNGRSKVVNLDSTLVSTLLTKREMWLEAENEASTPLTVNYSTRSTSTVPEGSRRIYLAKPYGWQNDEPSWENIGIYHWGDYTDIGWNAGIKMHYLGNSGSDGYHYYYADIPKAINGNKVSNIIFQGWGSNQAAGTYSKAQTGNIENIPDSANFYILSKDGNAFVGTKSEEDAVIPNYTRYVSSVAMNNTESTEVNISPTYTGGLVTYTPKVVGTPGQSDYINHGDYVTVDRNGVIHPVKSTIGLHDECAEIIVKVYSTIGRTIYEGSGTDADDCLTYTVRVNIHDPNQFNGFEIMSFESKTYTVNIPEVSGNQPGYFDMSNVVMTVEGIHGVTSSTSSAIITQTSTASVSGIGTVCTAFTVKYAKANSDFTGYNNIRITGKTVTKSIKIQGDERYGQDHWEVDDVRDDTIITTRKIYSGTDTSQVGIETATTNGIPFNSAKTTYSDIFAAYSYVDVTFTFNYYEYKPKKVDADGNVVADNVEGMIQYPYDSTWAGGEVTSNANFAASHTQKTFTVSNYEVRGKTADNITTSDLATAAATAIGVMPSNNYYTYSIAVANTTKTKTGTYTANSTVNMTQNVRNYSVYLNGSLVRNNYKYQEYAEPSVKNASDWYAVDSIDPNASIENAPLLATNVNSYKFRVKGDTYLRTATATNPRGYDFIRSEVDFSHYEVVHRENPQHNVVDYLMQNFYIADFFSPANVLDPQSYTGKGKFGVAYKVEEVTASTTASSGNITVYFTDSLDWDNICIYYWGENINNINWPGRAMTQFGTDEDGKKIYSAEIPGTAEGVIFTGNNNQTVDITNNIANGSHWKSKSETVQNGIPYDDAKFVGGGVVYFSVDEQGNPRSSNAKDLGYVNGDGTLNQDAVKEMLKSEILASVNEGNYGKYTVEEDGQTVQKSVSYESLENAIGTEDALKVAYGTEIAAHQYVENNIKTGVLYRYLPLETFSKDSDNWSNGVPVKDEKGNYYTTLNNNTFRYSNTLQSYQYVYASGNENKETNAGKNMRLYSYYVYSYVAYNQETNVPETKYEIVLSDNYSDASTYWNGK